MCSVQGQTVTVLGFQVTWFLSVLLSSVWEPLTAPYPWAQLGPNGMSLNQAAGQGCVLTPAFQQHPSCPLAFITSALPGLSEPWLIQPQKS